jgi:aquaporin Z
MATKKAGSTKKTSRAKSQSAKAKLTTVKAVAAVKSRKSAFLKLDDKRSVFVAALVGEFIGTFLLAVAYLSTKGEPLYMGFVLIALVLMIGTLSGAYLNPLLTFGAWVTRKIGHLRAVGYVLAQVLGGVAALVVLSAFANANQSADANSMNALSQAPQVFKLDALQENTQWFVFFAELLGATIFAFAVASVWRYKTDDVARALGSGLGLFVAALTASVCAGYVMARVAINPALALSAQAIDFSSVNWFAVAVYVVAPLLGGVIGYALRDAVETK